MSEHTVTTITNSHPSTNGSIGACGKEVIRIYFDGRIFWNGREIESDEMFRAAMIDLLAVLKEMK